jgi:hypothetical protein
MVVSPMIAAHTVLVCMRILLARARPVNQLDVLISLIVESGRDAEKPRWQRISTARPAGGRPVLWSRDWSILHPNGRRARAL